MKNYTSADLRNFAIVGHANSGKTILSEAMLVNAGAIDRMGTIAGGNTTSDYDAIEKERGNSVHATPLHAEWQGRKLNIIDTPGYLDFNAEALGSMIACDFAVIVVSAHDGAQVGTDIVWDFATQFGIPKVIVLNGHGRRGGGLRHRRRRHPSSFRRTRVPRHHSAESRPRLQSDPRCRREESRHLSDRRQRESSNPRPRPASIRRRSTSSTRSSSSSSPNRTSR